MERKPKESNLVYPITEDKEQSNINVTELLL